MYIVLPTGRVIGPRGKVLKEDIGIRGHRRITMSFDGKITRILVHRLVAGLYLENPYHLPLVQHIDGDPSNNRVENLEWSTYKLNVKDGWERGRHNHNRYSAETEQLVIDMIEQGVPKRHISRSLGMDHGTPLAIYRRHTESATTIPKGSTA